MSIEFKDTSVDFMVGFFREDFSRCQMRITQRFDKGRAIYISFDETEVAELLRVMLKLGITPREVNEDGNESKEEL